MAIFMKYGSIDGAVTTDGYKKWIELNSLQWRTGRGIASAAHSATSREHSEPSLSEITVTKQMDVSSPKLFIESVAGELDTKVTIKIATTAKGPLETFLTYELENTGISSYKVESTGHMPTEYLSLNYTKIKKTFNGLGPTLSGAPETVGYDLTKMKTV